MTIKAVKELSVREQAEAEVRAENHAANVVKMKRLIKDRAAAEMVVATIVAQITDLEVQLAEGTN